MRNFFKGSFVFLILGLFLALLPFSLPEKPVHTALEIILKLFQLFAVPLLSFSLTSSISGMRNIQELKHFGVKVLKYTLLTTQAAAFTALILFAAFRPKVVIEGSLSTNSLSFSDAILGLFPSHIFSPFIDHNVFAAILIFSILGIGALFLEKSAKEKFVRFAETGFRLFLKVFDLLVRYLLPILVLISSYELFKTLRTQSFRTVLPLVLFFSIVLGANLIQGLVTLPLLLKGKGIRPWPVLKAAIPALTVAFFAKSSSSALSRSMELSTNTLKIDERLVRFSLPLCTTINMNGCAAFIFLALMFNFTSFFGPVSWVSMILWSFAATGLAMGNASMPMGCFFLSSMVLSAFGIGDTLMAMILPFYAVLDMVESALNVWSDIVVTRLVHEDLIPVAE